MSTTILAASYAGFLLAVAGVLDALARHSHRRTERYRTAGFAFRPDIDAWECPEGEYLRLVQTDHHRRVARYRASAQTCNACPAKEGCTDSFEGREVTRALDPWPHSEAGRFHRGVCVVLAALAGVIAAIGLAVSGAPAEAAVAAGTLALAIAVASRLWSAFRRTPAGFAESQSGSGDATMTA